MLTKPETIQLFRYKAEQVSAIVKDVANVEEGMVYAVDVCNEKEACTILPTGCELDLSESAQHLCQDKPAKLIAATDLDRAHKEMLASYCGKAGIRFITHGLRNYLGGVDIGLTWAQYGIAETGTVVIDSTDEDLRLSTMVSEIHMVLLPASAIFESAADKYDQFTTKMKQKCNYLAMITGASRTADIERVLALGVHGPLELHIILIGASHVGS